MDRKDERQAQRATFLSYFGIVPGKPIDQQPGLLAFNAQPAVVRAWLSGALGYATLKSLHSLEARMEDLNAAMGKPVRLPDDVLRSLREIGVTVDALERVAEAYVIDQGVELPWSQQEEQEEEQEEEPLPTIALQPGPEAEEGAGVEEGAE